MAVDIILAITLIISLSMEAEALLKSYKEKIIDQTGRTYDTRFETTNYFRAEELKADSVVEKVSMVTALGKYKIPNSN
jgi:hypothetical protein